jgi:hypothetical protein
MSTACSLFDATNSGKAQAGIGSLQFRMVLGPFYKTEFFFGAGAVEREEIGYTCPLVEISFR